MNLQLFGYDDGFYYGQCKLIFEAETVSDNGKTVTISDGTTTKSGIVVDKKCEFLVPGRSLWIVTLLDVSDAIWTGKVEAGYGDCKHIMLADGYESVMEKDVLSLDEIEAATNVDGYIPDASAVKQLNNNLGGLRFGIDGDSKYGYYKADDSFVPFRGNTIIPIVAKQNTGSNTSKTIGLSYSNFVIGKEYFLFVDAQTYSPSISMINADIVNRKITMYQTGNPWGRAYVGVCFKAKAKSNISIKFNDIGENVNHYTLCTIE